MILVGRFLSFDFINHEAGKNCNYKKYLYSTTNANLLEQTIRHSLRFNFFKISGL